jgi:hypothetical protein
MCNCLTRRSFLAVAPITLLAQNKAATIYGTIRFRNGQPARGLAIVVGPRFNYTDVNGYYRIVGVPYGMYNMQIRQGNRTLKQGQISVNAAQVLHDDVI